MSGGGNIKVVVRCRPMNGRELARKAVGLIRMDGDQTIITRPPDQRTGKESEDVKSFTFDKSYWSADKSDPRYADQQRVYDDLGVDLLDHAFDGYNCCIFAYGQTGAGKSYSMMGYGEDKGIIPRTCSALFDRIHSNQDARLTTHVEVSYIEIYNEKVRDLLNPKNKGNLKVREHPSLGPYVEDLSKSVVSSFENIENLMDEGNKARTVAATQMNETSSRSHAVFTLILTQKRQDELTKLETEKVARISLVDLAGSERANSTGATGARLKEGANINRSLTTLGKVIAGLAEQSTQQEVKKGKKKEVFIPYRDSVLTWLLKDSLGGNSKTTMIAAISQCDYDETLSTLRYADQAKRIKNKAVVNEDPNAKLIRDLKDELELLRDRLRTYAPEEVEQLTAASAYKASGGGGGAGRVKAQQPKTSLSEIEFQDSQGQMKKMSKEEVIAQLQRSEKLYADLNESLEDKLRKTEQIHLEREQTLKELGITIEKNETGVHAPKTIPFIINLNEDPLMSECLMYQIKPGMTKLGRMQSEVEADIRLSGPNIQDEHCTFENHAGTVTLHPGPDSIVMVNGARVTESCALKSGYRIILGFYHIFRFNHPEEVRKTRDLNREEAVAPAEVIDWSYARREAVLSYYSAEANLSEFNDEELEKLYGGIEKIRNGRRTRCESRTDHTDDTESVTTRDSYRNSSLMNLLEDESVSTDMTLGPSEQLLEERLKLENKKRLDDQRMIYEAELHRMSRQFSQAPEEVTQTPYTERELGLIRKVLRRWRAMRTVDMAEVILTHAVMLKEANIIARELKKGVMYQFAVIEHEPSVSFWENHLYETDEDRGLILTPKPCVGIRVIDKKNLAVYLWSIEKLQQRLHKMRNLCFFLDKPSYSQHFNWEDPFFETPSPIYSLLGVAHVPMTALVYQQPYEHSYAILCPTTGDGRGHLRVLISPLARSVVARREQERRSFDEPLDSEEENEEDPSTLQVGQNLLFEIRLVALTGLSELDYTDVHVQFRLSSFGGVAAYSASEKFFTTEPMRATHERLEYAQTLSLVVTESVLEVLMYGFVGFEIFGRAQRRALHQYERWDDQREPHPSLTTVERISEEAFLTAERHDVVAWIEMCELAPTGQYVPVSILGKHAMDRGYFLLRQGLQRQICFTLSHTSGHQLTWRKIKRATLGHVRLLDGRGHLLESSGPESRVEIQWVSNQEVAYGSDGTSRLTAQATWDSSGHDCPFLNQRTEASGRVLLNLRWEVEVERCEGTVEFSMDIALQIGSRERSSRRLLERFWSSRRLTKYCGVFSVHLKPPRTKRTSQLWRLNTAGQHVNGEEFLGSWKPRGVSLLQDYQQMQARVHRKNRAALTRQMLSLSGEQVTVDAKSAEEQEALLRKVLALWQLKLGTAQEIVLPQAPPCAENVQRREAIGGKLLAHVEYVHPTSVSVSKRGYVLYQQDAARDLWIQRWFVIRRPYIYIYENESEYDEQGVINVGSVRIDYNRQLEQMIKRNNVFAVYTNNNAYTLQAETRQDMIQWIQSIDQKFPLETLTSS
ncbi:hypothetical protein BY458DRAFT_520451 [Sporodiniella umbellata]|nr:hypothetical protein BY458DRAFT_520451 [Sporodiniella umbellata]